jgi:hypothetical protein
MIFTYEKKKLQNSRRRYGLCSTTFLRNGRQRHRLATLVNGRVVPATGWWWHGNGVNYPKGV